MQKDSTSKSKSKSYFSGSFIMFLGLIYNIIEQDFFGSAIFLISSVVFLSQGIIKKRAIIKESSVS
ncbi:MULTISPECIES: hypothetical protein [Colwellia]|uniref:YrhK domain-containing protein n=1 Tax=Colwellia marinimaniae TaxID=1513592 RepID=A0ABQ0MY98_9GAMM|nr:MULTISPECIES: hypothetical protein [Colwellia]GAW97330.1 hypothetical protein MTCD1_02957 [Colwellia marinimaniae]